MKKIILTLVVAAALDATAHQSTAAENAWEQLKTITSAMNSFPDIIFYKDKEGVYRGGNFAWITLLEKPSTVRHGVSILACINRYALGSPQFLSATTLRQLTRSFP